MDKTMTEPTRLSKCIAAMVPCSRAEADQYIEGGWVRVNGVVMEKPHYKVTDESIEIDPDAVLVPLEPVTLLLNKPAGLDAHSDEVAKLIGVDSRDASDPDATRVLYRHFRQLKMASELEASASGLLVFTQNPNLERKLIEDARKIQQEYVVEVSGEIVADGLTKMQSGMRLKAWPLPPAQVSWQSENRLRIATTIVHQGQIAFMCDTVGLKVESMRRIRIGGVPMGKIPLGQWRYLPAGARF